MIDNISVVMIAKNASQTLQASLDSLKSFDEIILYLNNSSDNTKEIAQKYKNVKIIKGDFLGFGPTKNLAASYAKSDWIFSIDSDEVIGEELLKNIKKLQLNNSNIYEIKRYNYYKEKKINHCGWGEEKIIRLYNKTVTAFNDNMVHEKIMIKDLNLFTIDGELKHYPYNSITQFIQKADYYSEIFAKEKAGKKSSTPTKAFLNAAFSFFKTYILKKGFLDGYVGLLISVSHAVTNFYKYMKLYELNRDLK